MLNPSRFCHQPREYGLGGFVGGRFIWPGRGRFIFPIDLLAPKTSFVGVNCDGLPVGKSSLLSAYGFGILGRIAAPDDDVEEEFGRFDGVSPPRPCQFGAITLRLSTKQT